MYSARLHTLNPNIQNLFQVRQRNHPLSGNFKKFNKPPVTTNSKYYSNTLKRVTMWNNYTVEMKTSLSLLNFTQLYKKKFKK